MIDRFARDGFVLLRGYFRPVELQRICEVVRRFHRAWLRDNRRGFRDGLVNSAYLTARGELAEPDRLLLFRFVAQNKLLRLARPLLAGRPTFINTQLFFAPYDRARKNYWHRDVQYTGLSEARQREALQSQEVWHFRIALADDPGIELIPGSHRRWDSELERDVRLERGGRRNWEDLPDGRLLPMRRGDLLVFSTNMLHRAVYDQQRFSLDVLLSTPDPLVTRYVRRDCLPGRLQARRLRRLALFERGRRRPGVRATDRQRGRPSRRKRSSP
ncbi:Phytanoyl-CoA dioxygenase [Azotobacter vinelandii CA]|uniref:Phytanoyl-CoA dioxygenase n=2 Tax=Azotobacter vinelandii TaxID=354 RepID=C1DJX1_AZOVD|nr:phytanoyl-CoA dioxygenase family protein [Azotobacter vinelandii]ACO78890.1 Phytanoyl-CoA dioxygenase [Azotobacter vinelandii DJ]AGK16565.1 Phytanoyl-CoA dioxygenase [Azotobacter vinelandii CA]AGK20836.1 Phytanoyl-CoA dioxygenase [Azotobacter vinelandii CA6]WKN19888.1 phytanoyl-CoA dioxygenase family protein [Azotobacter vinelandii]SFY16941.1 Phytanoyl-CoA dioxygenase (PhyH) [Azotobacter vinelandii]